MDFILLFCSLLSTVTFTNPPKLGTVGEFNLNDPPVLKQKKKKNLLQILFCRSEVIKKVLY